MKEIKQEIIQKSLVTKYEANDGIVFDSIEECERYEASAKCVLLSKYKELQVKFINEEDMFGLGSPEYWLSVAKLRNESDIDLVMQLYCLFHTYDSKNEEALKNARNKCKEAVKNGDLLLINRGYEYDEYDSFFIMDTLTNKLNSILKCCDPGSVVAIVDNLTLNDEIANE